MTTTSINYDAPRLETPADQEGRLEARTTRLETPAEDVIPDLAFILGLVYLEAGLPPEAALRSGLADYECSFSEVEMEGL